MKLPVILLAGPTAAGKTVLAIELAERLGTQIISADSMQVYRNMDVGTAKPSAEERSLVVHHLIDVVDPDEPFDAAQYLQLARPIVEYLHSQGKVPVVVGGTGLYMKVLTLGICPVPPGDPRVRQELSTELKTRGLFCLYAELNEVDPALAVKLNPNDRQRITRALEVYRSTGETLSRWQEQHAFRTVLFPSIRVFISRSRDDIYARIDRRVDVMMQNGFLDEVAGLLAMGYSPDLKSLQSLGYKQLIRYLSGGISLEAAVRQTKLETRHYAKRQITWFRGDSSFRWLDADDETGIIEWIEDEVDRWLGVDSRAGGTA